MKVKLVVAKGRHAGKVISVHKAKFLLGRHKECDLQVTSPKVSVHHARMRVRGEALFVRDLESKNGTFVNDERITEERELQDGDKVRLGPLVMKVQLEQGAFGTGKHEVAITESDAAEILAKGRFADAFLVEDSKYASTILSLSGLPPDPDKKK